jgi:hypothetical protein
MHACIAIKSIVIGADWASIQPIPAIRPPGV